MTEPTNNPQPIAAPTVVTSERLEALATRNARPITGSLFVFAALFAARLVYGLFQLNSGGLDRALPLTGLLLLLAVIWISGCLVWSARLFRQLSPGERLRLTLVSVGGLSGIVLALYALVLPFANVEYRDVFGGGFKEWRKHPEMLFWTGLPLIGGLLLAFGSLLLTSGLERSSAMARRLLYGYNAVLSGLLLLFIFLLVNILPYSGIAPFKALAQTSDWTSNQMYSLSQATKDRLASLDKPVKIYVLLSAADSLNNEVDTLLQNCREITNQVSSETLSPELNRIQVEELIKKNQMINGPGLLVIYGTAPDTSKEFIPRKDLFTESGGRGEEAPSRFVFKGEAALAKALTYVVEDKKKPIVYFTQDHGELEIEDLSHDRPDKGIGDAVRRLRDANYDVKALKFDPKKPIVPDDADLVVVARPLTEFSPAEVTALRNFAGGDSKKKGKLFVLMGVVPTRDGKMAQTGLEPWLAEYGVQVGNDRLIAVGDRPFFPPLNPAELLVRAKPHSTNPIARAFAPEGGEPQRFIFFDARKVAPAQTPNPAARYTTEELLLVPAGQLLVPEPDLNADPETAVSQLRMDPAKANAMLLQESPAIAVTVSESKSPSPPVPGHEFMRGDSQPRMVVVGCANWATNYGLGERGANYDLLVSCVNWLRERPEIGVQAIADKTRAEYRLPPDVGGLRLLVMPAALILVCVVCLGTGVWIVRRR